MTTLPAADARRNLREYAAEERGQGTPEELDRHPARQFSRSPTRDSMTPPSPGRCRIRSWRYRTIRSGRENTSQSPLQGLHHGRGSEAEEDEGGPDSDWEHGDEAAWRRPEGKGRRCSESSGSSAGAATGEPGAPSIDPTNSAVYPEPSIATACWVAGRDASLTQDKRPQTRIGWPGPYQFRVRVLGRSQRSQMLRRAQHIIRAKRGS